MIERARDQGARRVAAGVVWRLRLLEAGERVAKLGSWEWFPDRDEQLWSDNLYRIFGLKPREITPTRTFVLKHTHPDDRERVASYVEMTRGLPGPPPIEFRIQQPGRDVRHVRSTITTVEVDSGGAKRIVGVVQDVTDERLANREIAAHVAVSKILADWDCFEESGQRLLASLGEAMECVFGALWLPHGDLLVARLTWNDPSLVDPCEFDAATRALRVPRSMGLPGLVWRTQAPVDMPDVRSNPNYRRRNPATRAGLRGAVAFPALHAGEVLAVLEFYYREEVRLTGRSTDTMIAIGYELGEFVSRRRGQLYARVVTVRELQVLQLAADGCSGPEIAERLGVSPTTIATHMKHIYHRLGVSDRAAAVAATIRSGLVE